jgi:hypothetical protein
MAIDFGASYMTWTPHDPAGNIARIQLDAACTLADPASGDEETYYLIAPCRSERMYADGPLYTMPNYEFCGIWTERALLFLRTHWTSERDHREYGETGPPPARFREVRLDVRTFPRTAPLSSPAEIVEATLQNRPLIGRTELQDPASGARAVLEYPVKTINVARHPDRFQVDTGPLLAPDFVSGVSGASGAPEGPEGRGSREGRPIERFEVAHVVYNRLDRAELILRRPVPVGPAGGAAGDAPATTDYSEVRILSARNTLHCALP